MDFAVLIAIHLLKMVVDQIGGLWIGYPGSMRIWARIVTLRIFEYAIVHEISPWLHHSFGHNLFMDRTEMLSPRRWRLNVSRHGWLWKSARLSLCQERLYLFGGLG